MVEVDYKYKKNSVLLGCGGRKFLPFFMWIKYNIIKQIQIVCGGIRSENILQRLFMQSCPLSCDGRR